MRGGVSQQLAFVVTARDDLAGVEAHDDGTDGHIVVIGGGECLVERDAHERVEVDRGHVAASAFRSARSTVPRSIPCSSKRKISS